MSNVIVSYSNIQNAVKQDKSIFKQFETNKFKLQTSKNSYENAQKNLNSAIQQNGLIEKAADYIKDETGFGVSKNTIQKQINSANKNEEEINAIIKNYRISQENTMQTIGDAVSSIASIYTFFKVKNFTKLFSTKLYTLNKENLKSIIDNSKQSSLFIKKFMPLLEKNYTFIAIGAIASSIAGSQIKPLFLALNRIGTKQYEAQIPSEANKKEAKTLKKQAFREKWGANFRNFASGGINGLTTPLLSANPIIGAPAYLLVNSFSKFFIAEKENKGEKNLNSFIDNISNSKIVNAAGAAAILAVGLKKANFSKVFEENLAIAKSNIETVYKSGKLKQINFPLSSYEKLEKILFDNPEIKAIMEEYNRTYDEVSAIQKLGNANIFALKFQQIALDTNSISKALKENCPQSRNLTQAQEYINEKLGENQYTLSKLVGVGTIAETYLAVNKEGKEVCIKILKEGISEEKILKDKNSFIQMVENTEQISPQEKHFLIENINNIAEGVLQEVNFANEKNAALELAKVTKNAKVVKPIDVINNVYIMEKADGISLQHLIKELYNSNCTINLTESDAKNLIDLYQNALIEQFAKINAEGKIIHGDIHPGNIFIDIEGLKQGKKDCLTLIDTGNTINQTSENAIRFMQLSKYIGDADVDNISKFVLDGAKLPDNITKQEAEKIISDELKTLFFSVETNLPIVTNDGILKITEGIMQKYNIIPSNTQAGLLKAKTSANTSLLEFYEALYRTISSKDNNNNFVNNKILSFLKIVCHQIKYSLKKSAQAEANFAMLNPLQKMNFKTSESTPKKNSVEYLTYSLKQYKTDEINQETLSRNFDRIVKNMFSI